MIYIDTNLDKLTAEYDGDALDVSWVDDTNLDELTSEYDGDPLDVSWEKWSNLIIKINSYDGKWHRIDIYNEDKDASTYFYVTGYR